MLYGGAAGGGKSYALLADAASGFWHPQFKGLLVRRTNDELRELKIKSQELYPKAFKAKWSEKNSEWVLPNGARLWMSYLERDDDVMRYQGQSFTWVGFDELTQWPTPHAWNYLMSRVRTTSPDLKVYMRATTNPGGPGHNWVKKMFIDPAPWGEAFWATDIETGDTLVYPDNHSSRAGQPLFKRRFIPSKLQDNPHLYDDGQYEMKLIGLPEVQKRQLLDGDWDVAYGAAFPEWNRRVHTVEPFDIPREWVKFRACDYGYSSYSAVLWFAVAPDDQLIVYRELYVKKMLAQDLADYVLYLEQDDGPISYGVLDSSTWSKRGDPGPSIAEQMIARGCRWRPSDRSKNSRVAGKNEIHRRLQIDDFTEQPRLIFFDDCLNSIAQLPVIPLDKDNPEDVDTKAEDHIYDALRYGVMSRPRSHVWDYDRPAKRWTPSDPVFGY